MPARRLVTVNGADLTPTRLVDRYYDERLRITGIEPGRYDVKLTDKNGRVCIVRNVEVKDGAVFSIEEKQLTDRRKPYDCQSPALMDAIATPRCPRRQGSLRPNRDCSGSDA
jgi:hypothetical protein